MSKKLQKNGLWESSRMMLPQHKEALLNRRLGLDQAAQPARTAEKLCHALPFADDGNPKNPGDRALLRNAEIAVCPGRPGSCAAY
ncbi:hypothetical protein J6TS7_14890 [Paenibacillus dendritiformis]|nr:hypothetical protein J6TS7_14890 [Paenibacillus dendritiformis]